MTDTDAIEAILYSDEYVQMRLILSWKYLLERENFPTTEQLRQYLASGGAVIKSPFEQALERRHHGGG